MTRGIFYIMAATFFFSLMNIMAKFLADLHAMQIVFFRAFGSLIILIPWLLSTKISVLGTHRKLLFIRAFVGLVSLATFFLAIQRMPLGSAISIRYLGPIFGAFFAFKLLKERIVPLQWVSFFIAFLGVLLLKGIDLRIDMIGFILIMVSAILVGVVFTMVRYLSQREHFLVIINYFMVTAVFFSLFFIPYWRMPEPSQWISVIGIGIFGLAGQVFMTKAFELEEANVLAPFKYLELFYAILLGIAFFDERYDLFAYLAMATIIFGMMLNVYAKTKKENKSLAKS